LSRYRVEFLSAAARDLRKLAKEIAKFQLTAIRNAVMELAEDPKPQQAKAVRGHSDLLRIRTGDYRIVYRVADEVPTVLVVAGGDRGDVYDRLLRRWSE